MFSALNLQSFSIGGSVSKLKPYTLPEIEHKLSTTSTFVMSVSKTKLVLMKGERLIGKLLTKSPTPPPPLA